jgi:hypothetical protein
MQQRRKDPDADRLLARYDPTRKSVTISFQGQVHVMPERYSTYDEAMVAGYAFANAQGWRTGA